MNARNSAFSNPLFPLLAGLALGLFAPVSMAAEEPVYLRPSIPPSNELDFSEFGTAVDTQGTLLVSSAPNVNAVYVFALQGGAWEEVAIVPAAGSGTGFGADVSLDGNAFAVGAPEETVNGIPGAGAIYVFERGDDVTEWTLSARIVASNPATDAHFGESVELDGNQLAAVAAAESGSVYLFRRDPESGEWNETFLLPAISPDSVDVSGDTLVFAHGGAADVDLYEYDGASWFLKRQFSGDSSPQIALEDDVFALGLRVGSIDERNRGEGIVEIYERGVADWNLTATLHASNPYPTYAFGYNVALRDGVLAVEQRPENGVAHVFMKDENGDWQLLVAFNAVSYRGAFPDTAISARTFAMGLSFSARVLVLDIAALTASSGEDEGDDGDNGGDDDSDDGNAGAGDDNGGDSDTDTGDDPGDEDTGGDDDADSDDGAGGDAGDETGSGGGDGGEAADSGAMADDDSGGGSLGWVVALLGVLTRRKASYG